MTRCSDFVAVIGFMIILHLLSSPSFRDIGRQGVSVVIAALSAHPRVMFFFHSALSWASLVRSSNLYAGESIAR